MKRIDFPFFILLLIFISCKSKNPPSIGENVVASSLNDDSLEIRRTVLDFYTWYSRNYEKLMQFDLYSGIKKEDAPPYRINWGEVKKYQDFIRDNVSQLGTVFLENQATLFKKCDSAFKVDVEEEVPYYFDFDWFTNSQEGPQYLLDEISKSNTWIVSVDGDKATLEIKGEDATGGQPAVPVINIELRKENYTWKIARIGNE